MDTLMIRQKLYEYIKVADDKKVEAIYTIVKEEINEPYEWWNDEELIMELDRRSADLKSGKDAGVSWVDTKDRLLSRLKKDEL